MKMISKIVDNWGILVTVATIATSWGVLTNNVVRHDKDIAEIMVEQKLANEKASTRDVMLGRIDQKLDYLRCEVTGRGCSR
jgi:hypothetical protein